MKRVIIALLALALLLAACGQRDVLQTTQTQTAVEVQTTTEALTATVIEEPGPADSELTAALLERYAEEILRAPPARFRNDTYIRLSKDKTVIAAAVGDINGDGKPDLVATVEIAPDRDRETYVLLAEGNEYKVRHMNQGLVTRYDEGGAFGDPFDCLRIEDGVLTISLYGGSAWRWAYQYHFKYNGGKLMLVKTEGIHFNIVVGYSTITVCDYTNGTVESRNWDEGGVEGYRGDTLLYSDTFRPTPSTFDAPVIDDWTYYMYETTGEIH